ncbi:MAG: hypothetical protein Q8M08_03015 [Bacteroidales bacterium]|nr:hypothetical protein [Bacteroidales bacterium]
MPKESETFTVTPPLNMTPLGMATGDPELNVTPAPAGPAPKYQLLNSP